MCCIVSIVGHILVVLNGTTRGRYEEGEEEEDDNGDDDKEEDDDEEAFYADS